MQQTESGPGRTGYVIAIIVFVLGLIGAGALVAVFVFGLMDLGSDLDRMVAPGSTQFTVSEPVDYEIYYEYQSDFQGRSYSTGSQTPNVDIQITRVEDGASIPVENTGFSSTYDLPSRSGESIRQFSIDEPGDYEMTVSYAGGQDGPEFVLAYGEGIGLGIVTSVGSFFAGGLVFCLMTLVAIAIAGVTLYRRSRSGNQPST